MNTKTAARTIDMGNNEQVTIGLVPQDDGTFLALTFTVSKTFKTRKGAEAWLSGRGYNANGSRR